MNGEIREDGKQKKVSKSGKKFLTSENASAKIK